MIVLKVDALQPDDSSIRIAVDAIRQGKLVVFPTETVYGLAADALNETAVKRVFEAKGRMENHPLPVQLAGVEQLEYVASAIPDQARLLAAKYWPGPMTLILPKSDSVSNLVSGGHATVGVRVPDHPVALAMLRELGTPIVATSANISGERPARSAKEAAEQLCDSISVVLDSGESYIGVASTVIDVSVTPPRILRRGSISESDIIDVVGAIESIDS